MFHCETQRHRPVCILTCFFYAFFYCSYVILVCFLMRDFTILLWELSLICVIDLCLLVKSLHERYSQITDVLCAVIYRSVTHMLQYIQLLWSLNFHVSWLSETASQPNISVTPYDRPFYSSQPVCFPFSIRQWVHSFSFEWNVNICLRVTLSHTTVTGSLN